MEILTLKGKIKIITGLHIGGSDDTMKIGGVDNSIIKIYDRELKREVPYIPGSSLKGKIRSLLEWSYGVAQLGDGEPFGSDEFLKYEKTHLKEKKDELINFLKLFGDSSSENRYGMTRAIFSDCFLTDDIKENINDIEIREIKTENMIDRSKGTAKNPRQTERVAPEIEFEFEISIKVLDGDDKNEFKKIIEKGLKLLELDYLGGNGSRGYGRVKIDYKDWENETI